MLACAGINVALRCKLLPSLGAFRYHLVTASLGTSPLHTTCSPSLTFPPHQSWLLCLTPLPRGGQEDEAEVQEAARRGDLPGQDAHPSQS